MAAAGQPHAFFGRNSSVLLDLVRFGAALAVAIIHLQDRFYTHKIEPDWAGNAAVCVFFVLSGFVIRFVTRSRVTGAGSYWIDRSSRIYSVVLPALMLTLLFEGVAFLHSPAIYHRYSDPFEWTQVPAQMLANLTFTVGFWGYGATPLSNGPFWSLSFECVYYVLYGLLLYRMRWSGLLLVLLLLAVGPSIGLLFPVWLLGAGLYDVYNRLHAERYGVGLAAAVALVFFGLVAALRHPIGRLLAATDVHQRSRMLTHVVDSTRLGHALFGGATLPWLDRLSVSFYLTGTATAVMLLFVLLFLDRYVAPLPATAARIIRLVADSTFALYLLHLPLFILIGTFLGQKVQTPAAAGLLLLAAIALSIVMAIFFDRLKNALRAALRSRFSPSERREREARIAVRAPRST
jgi:peptidoglycan/LPS O-acetylase OafA/YrhL